MSSIRPIVGDVVRTLDEFAPTSNAASWDRVGLLAGDSRAAVTGVMVTLDPTLSTIDDAEKNGANVLVTHHPAFLTPPERITPTGGSAELVFQAISKGIALVSAHTNLDRHPGAGSALARALGLVPQEPLESSERMMAMVTVYVLEEAADSVRGAMADAGAGMIEDYRACSFTSEGTGRFTPGLDAVPAVGVPGMPERLNEERIEMVCAPDAVPAVLAAVRRVHPYETPVSLVSDIRMSRGSARMGAVCSLESPISLARFAAEVREALGSPARVWGDADSLVASAAVATGSGGSLIPGARRVEADVLVAGEVRYHDAMDAVSSGLSIIEIGHDISEWPLVPLLREAVLGTPGLPPSLVYMDPPSARWWTS